MRTGIEMNEVDDENVGSLYCVGRVVGALLGGNTNTKAEVVPREVTFTLAVTVAPRATEATFRVRVKFPDENAAAI